MKEQEKRVRQNDFEERERKEGEQLIEYAVWVCYYVLFELISFDATSSAHNDLRR